jgi:hypothetical protein
VWPRKEDVGDTFSGAVASAAASVSVSVSVHRDAGVGVAAAVSPVSGRGSRERGALTECCLTCALITVEVSWII